MKENYFFYTIKFKNSNRPTRIREKIKQYMYCPYVNSVLIILNLSETISIIISVVLLVFFTYTQCILFLVLCSSSSSSSSKIKSSFFFFIFYREVQFQLGFIRRQKLPKKIVNVVKNANKSVGKYNGIPV